MSDIVEKNDVDISKIFDWGRVFEIVNPRDDSVESLVYMKILGDADLGIARVYALRKSSEMRRKLRDTDSDERIAYIKDSSELTKDELVNLGVAYSSREIIQQARQSVKLQSPKPPSSSASLEKMEKFQKEVDAYPAKKKALILKATEEGLDAIRKELGEKSLEDLYIKYVKLLIDEMCEQEALQAFKNMQVYLGCYKSDEYKTENRYFSSFDEFSNLEPVSKQRFKDAYDSIEIEMGELKKLRRATL